MNDLPPQRDLPPGHLELRRRMLLSEASRKPQGVRVRVVVLAAGVASALVAAAAVGVVLRNRANTETGGSSAPSYLLAEIQSPEAAALNEENPLCEGENQELFGCGTLRPRSTPASVSQPPTQFATTTEITGGPKARRALLRSIIRATRPNTIVQVELESSPRSVSLVTTTLDNSSVTGWQTGLIAAAFRDRLLARGREVAVELDGVELPGGPATLPAAGPRTVARARERFETAAAASGATLESLEIYRPYGVAVAATIATADPAAFLARGMPDFLREIGDPWEDYDGVDVRLVDANGAVVWEFATAGRTSTGSVGGREDLVNCGPVGDWDTAGPPCPVQ
jgi:hypothetical protein